MSIVIAGFLLGISLIVAIGPQNALIIRQGIKRHAVVPVLLVCMASDIILILGGTAGVGALIEKAPIALVILKYVGAAYLAWFGYSCFRDAVSHRGSNMVINHSDEIKSSTPVDSDLPATSGSVAVKTRTQTQTWVKPVLAALAFTWLNPAAYIDALIMLGGMANQHGETGRWYFAFGALLASATWFPLLGFGSSYFSDVLARPQAWRIINFAIGCIMVVMCARLLMH